MPHTDGGIVVGRKGWASEPEFEFESDDMPLDFDEEGPDYADLADSFYDRRWDEDTDEQGQRAHRRRGTRSRSNGRDDWD